MVYDDPFTIDNHQPLYSPLRIVLIFVHSIFRVKDNMQTLGNVETKLLYTLHWILLDASDECAENDYENGKYFTNPFYYMFSVPAMTVS